MKLLLLLAAASVCFADSYLFTSFRKNGETGVYLALSRDGRTWKPLNNNRPWIRPEHDGMLMRDPFVTKGPDGVWHLLWTWGWDRKQSGGGLKLGHSTSRDLLTWSEQTAVPLFETEPDARNVWAPEAVWDAKRKEWIVFWSSTISGRFPQTASTGDNNYNHRIYYTTTADWRNFAPAKLWFDCEFNCIDSTVLQDRDQWIMIFKDERKVPLRKNLRLAFSSSPGGPWKATSETFTPSWVEGPSALKIDGTWWIYFDHYTNPRHYGAVTTSDWHTFQDRTADVRFPEDHRHGTAVAIPTSLADQLERQERP